MKSITLFEGFNIQWLIRQVDGNSFPVFVGRDRKETLDILTGLQKEGYRTIRNTPTGVIAEENKTTTRLANRVL